MHGNVILHTFAVIKKLNRIYSSDFSLLTSLQSIPRTERTTRNRRIIKWLPRNRSTRRSGSRNGTSHRRNQFAVYGEPLRHYEFKSDAENFQRNEKARRPVGLRYTVASKSVTKVSQLPPPRSAGPKTFCKSNSPHLLISFYTS